jgi:hypothetical protein
MDYAFDTQEMFTRIIKYLIEGLVVGIVASILPDEPLSLDKIILLGLTAAAMFSVLDLVAPSISTSARQGAGVGLGFNLVGFPM